MRSAAWALARRTASRGRWTIGRPMCTPVCACRIHTSARQNTASLTSSEGHTDENRPAPPPQRQSIPPTPHSYYPLPKNESQANELLLDFLNCEPGAPDPVNLPPQITKLDAYMHLRETAPGLLADMHDEALDRICMQAGVERLGGAVRVLLDDLEGRATDDDDLDLDLDGEYDLSRRLRQASAAREGGLFGAPSGSKRRMSAVQNLLLGASHRRSTGPEQPQSDDKNGDEQSKLSVLFSTSTLARAFGMLMADFEIMRKVQGRTSHDSPLPKGFNISVARRLVRTIAASNDPSVAPLLGELLKYLSRPGMSTAGDFPTAGEGCRIMDYYLNLEPDTPVESNNFRFPPSSVSSAPMQAANYVMDLMGMSEPEVVSETLIEAARKEGKELYDYLCRSGVAAEEASRVSYPFTIRSVLLLVLLKKGRFVLVQKQIQRIIKEVQSIANELGVEAPLWIPARSVRLSIYLALTLSHGPWKAFDLVEQFSHVMINATGSEAEANGAILKAVCERAVIDDEPQLATRTLRIFLASRKAEGEQLAPEAEVIGAAMLNRLANNLAKHGRGDMVAHLISQLGLVATDGRVIDGRIDRLFPTPLRAPFIALLAKSGLKEQAKSMYERWGTALTEDILAEDVRVHVDRILAEKPVRRKSALVKKLATSDAINAHVTRSTACLTTLVSLLVRDHRHPYVPYANKSEPLHSDVQFAYHILFQFQPKDRTLVLLDRQERVALASAYVSLRQMECASKCLAETARLEKSPTIDEARVLIRALGQVDLNKAVNVLVERAVHWSSEHGETLKGSRKSAGRVSQLQLGQLYTSLLERCFRYRKEELAKKLLESAKSNGLQDQVAIRSLESLIKYGLSAEGRRSLAMGPDEDEAQDVRLGDHKRGDHTLLLARWVCQLIEKEGWKPDVALMGWLISRATREGGIHSDGLRIRDVARGVQDEEIGRGLGPYGERKGGSSRGLQLGLEGQDTDAGQRELHTNHSDSAESSEVTRMGKATGDETSTHILSTRDIGGSRADDQKEEGNPSSHRRSRKDERYTLQDSQRRAAIMLLSITARRFGYVHAKAARDVVLSIQNKGYHQSPLRGQGERAWLRALARELDEVTSIVRWVQHLDCNDVRSLQDSMDNLQTSLPAGEMATEPNKLPASLYRNLIVAYLRCGDMLGAASIWTCARDEARLTMEDLEHDWKDDRKSFKEFLEAVAHGKGNWMKGNTPELVLQWFSGATPVPRVKMWWQRPGRRRAGT